MRSKISALGVKRWYLLLLVIVPLLFTGCELEDEEGEDDDGVATTSVEQGWHFPGRDCLACHNVDLKPERHLSFGGTLYRDKNVTNTDDITKVCGGELVIKFYDTAPSLQISSTYSEDNTSKGYKGKGNIFMLSRQGSTLGTNYFIQITDRSNNIFAVSPIHSFDGTDYNINNSTDTSNALSCNSCHKIGGITSPLYAQDNKNLCK